MRIHMKKKRGRKGKRQTYNSKSNTRNSLNTSPQRKKYSGKPFSVQFYYLNE